VANGRNIFQMLLVTLANKSDIHRFVFICGTSYIFIKCKMRSVRCDITTFV